MNQAGRKDYGGRSDAGGIEGREGAETQRLLLQTEAFRYCRNGHVVELPETHTILTCNPAFARMCGVDLSGIEGSSLIDCFVPEEQGKLIGQFLSSDLSGFGGCETMVKRKDGSVFYVQMDVVSVKDETGKVQYRIVTVRDISERRGAEKALSESEAKYRAVVESAPEGIFILKGGRFTWLNPAALVIYRYASERELLGRPVLDIIHPDFRVRFAEQIRLLNEERAVFPEIEQIHFCRDGSPVNVVLSGVPFFYQGNDSALFFVRDITARKKAEHEQANLQQQLYQSQKIESLGRLAGGVAHDLNNLLTPILGYTEILSEQFSENDQRQNHVKVMLQAALRARELIGQLLTFSRIKPFECRTIDLNGVIRGFEPLLMRTLREDIVLMVMPDKSPLIVRGDVGLLEQVIMNLAVNAQDAMPHGGKLVISTGIAVIEKKGMADIPVELDPGRFALLVVSDTGSGMGREVQEHIFEPFFTTKETGRGTGLGLSTVYGIVHQHGGSIQFRSQVGKGTVFTLWFPLVDRDVSDVEERPAEEKERRPEHHGDSILVVEDDEMVRSFVVQVLTQDGYTVIDVSAGEQAIELVDAGRIHPDLLLTDLVLRGMNGQELFEKIRQKIPGIVVIFMSGYVHNIDVPQGRPGSEYPLLQKPFLVHALKSKVFDVLNRGVQDRGKKIS